MKNLLPATRLFLLALLFNCISAGYSQCYIDSAMGYSHSAGIKADGTLWTWGRSAPGFANALNNKLVPTQVPNMTNCAKVFCGSFRTFVIKTNGTLWGAGENTYGQIGIGSFSSWQPAFVQIGTASNWKEVRSYNGESSIALKTDGTIWVWGIGDYGELGIDGVSVAMTPTQMGTDTNWKSISAGSHASFGVKTDGSLWGWGSGPLGNESSNSYTTPTTLGPSGVTTYDFAQISSGIGAGHQIALKNDGTLWTWGGDWSNMAGNFDNGALGQGFPTTYAGRSKPTQVGTDNDWTVIAAGFSHSMALKSNGTLWAWGNNYGGAVGDGTIVNKYVPTQIGTDSNWVSISGGQARSQAMKADGSIWVWGDNPSKELTAASPDTVVLVPTQVVTPGCVLANSTFETKKSKIGIAPNPSRSATTISFASEVAAPTITIYNILGTLVAKHLANSNTGNWIFETSTLPSGVYVVVLQDKELVLGQEKLVVE